MRSSGILLHITSLPSPYGIGDLGPNAYSFVNFLAKAGCKYWQFLPLGPTGYGNSPYQSLSAFAGNPLLISPEALFEDGFINKKDLVSPLFPEGNINYPLVISWKEELLSKAFESFIHRQSGFYEEYEQFCAENSYWLDDYSMYMEIKSINRGISWLDWPQDSRTYKPSKLRSEKNSRTHDVTKQKFTQFIFQKQWSGLRKFANDLGVIMFGDIPLYVALDSADVWRWRELFQFTKEGYPEAVAGVPPDYFSTHGQLWGNPLYSWSEHHKSGFHWWKMRFMRLFSLVDVVRFDHFRGLAAYWRIPEGSRTAENGIWENGPGDALLSSIDRSAFLDGKLPIIAEDLGVITEDVIRLRNQHNLLGMKVLQFILTETNAIESLNNIPKKSVTYTGTHDNNTVRGWLDDRSPAEKKSISKLIDDSNGDGVWQIIRLAWNTKSEIVISPMQDFLGLGSNSRMNFPGRPDGNWEWRLSLNQLNDELAKKIFLENQRSKRI